MEFFKNKNNQSICLNQLLKMDADSDSDLELIVIIATAAYLKYKKRRKKPRYRSNPYLMDRKTKGRFATDVSQLNCSALNLTHF